jgi:hypothetical protein
LELRDDERPETAPGWGLGVGSWKLGWVHGATLAVCAAELELKNLRRHW